MSNSSPQRSEESYISFSPSPRNANSSSFQNTRPYHRRSYTNQQGCRPNFHSTPYNRNNRNQFNFRNSTPRYRRFNQREPQSHDRSATFDVTKYFHPSMLENPWADLERKLNSTSDESSTTDQSECSEDEVPENDESHEPTKN